MHHKPLANITAIVLCHNDAGHLDDCLRTLRWADELFVVNMQSTDNTLEIASRWADRILSCPKELSLESAYTLATEFARNDWVLLAHPNDRMPQSLTRELQTILPFSQTTCTLRIPRQFYFRNKPLAQTPWGQNQHEHLLLLNTQRCSLNPHQPNWVVPHQNFTIDDMPLLTTMPVRHQWLSSYSQLPKQWFSQIPVQGMRLYQTGQHVDLHALTRKPITNRLRFFQQPPQLKPLLAKTSHALFNALSAGVCLMHQLRKTPKTATVAPTQAMQKAA